MSIGKRIREERKRQKLELKELAELSNVPVRKLGDIERGATSPRAENLKKIIIALGCSADQIIFDDNEITEDEELSMLFRELKKSKSTDKGLAKEMIKALLIKGRVDELNN